MEDVARYLGVSRTTVSYVLNESENTFISQATRERVLTAAHELGYRRNRAAQILRGGRSHIIELCVHAFYPAFYAQALQIFKQQLHPTPYQLHIVSPDEWNENAWKEVDGDWPVDGIIIFDVQVPDAVKTALKQRGVPIVRIGTNPDTNTEHVKVDLVPALGEAMRFLARRGSRVAYLSPWPVEAALKRRDSRYPTYQAVMREAKLPEEIIVAPEQHGLETRAFAREIMHDYVTKNGHPDAIFCFNDERAIAALAALRDLKLRVPEDVTLIGCDGIEDTAYHSPALSTIEYPVEETVRLAWQFLQHRIETPNAPLQRATLEARLVLRESSRV